MMMLLNRDGALVWDYQGERAASGAKATLDIPASIATQSNDLFDRVFAFAFDVMGVQTVELRIHGSDTGESRARV